MGNQPPQLALWQQASKKGSALVVIKWRGTQRQRLRQRHHIGLRQPVGVILKAQLTDGIARLLRREKVFAYRYAGQRYDCGSKLGFLQATVDLAEQHAEVGAEFKAWLAQRAGVEG